MLLQLVMEGVQAKQMQEALRLEVQTLKKKMQHSNSLLDLYKGKIVLLEDQVKPSNNELIFLFWLSWCDKWYLVIMTNYLDPLKVNRRHDNMVGLKMDWIYSPILH